MIVNYPRMRRRREAWPDNLDTALQFTSPNPFSISAPLKWDGKIEYCNGAGWQEWDGSAIVSGEIESDNYIYLRGTGNTKITGAAYFTYWKSSGSNIACNGSIELLLDWKTVKNGMHPIMAEYCFTNLFSNWKGLTTAPLLPATTLSDDCYARMFEGCTGLTAAPSLPATTLSIRCYQYMFHNCTGLTTTPLLPATKLGGYCYSSMFEGCTGLTAAPSLPATALKDGCYSSMLRNCTGLTAAPSLPATKLGDSCYSAMFLGCAGLTAAPSLPATALKSRCYQRMFEGCSKIKLSAVATGAYSKAYRIPANGTGTTASNALNNIFANTGGTFTGTPEINTTYYLDESNTIV